MIVSIKSDSLSMRDKQDGLVPFMVAAIGPNSNLSHIYNLLKLKPDILMLL